mgnify:CR=1 FL=1
MLGLITDIASSIMKKINLKKKFHKISEQWSPTDETFLFRIINVY